jgi:hypothetical protein
MTSRLFFIVIFALALNACGVKNDLEILNGQPSVDADFEDERDPSRPPQPLGL